jgi:hypothetical protein
MTKVSLTALDRKRLTLVAVPSQSTWTWSPITAAGFFVDELERFSYRPLKFVPPHA